MKTTKSKFSRLTFQDYYFLLTGKGEPVSNVFGENGRWEQLMMCLPIAMIGCPVLWILLNLVGLGKATLFGSSLPGTVAMGWLFSWMGGCLILMAIMEQYDKRQHKRNLAALTDPEERRREALAYMTVKNIEEFSFVLQGRGNQQEKLNTFAYVLLLYKELYPNGADVDIQTAVLKRAKEVYDNKWFKAERKLVEELFSKHIVPMKELTIA